MAPPSAGFVAPFFRASVALGIVERRLFARGLGPTEFEALVRAMPWILRQNLRRLLAAAALAAHTDRALVFVEGWRSNAVARPAPRPTRFVSGSWLFAALLRVLQRRGFVPAAVRVVRREVSRCTWEEARALLAEAAGRSIVGITDDPCPSAARAGRYLRGDGAAVITPAEALARIGGVPGALSGVWAAAQPRALEARLAPWIEAPNWALHLTSEALARVGLREPPLEVRLARALRRDSQPQS